MLPLLHPQNKTHFMFICLHVHVLVLIHEVGYLHGGGRSFGLGGTGSIMGMMHITKKHFTELNVHYTIILNALLCSDGYFLSSSFKYILWMQDIHVSCT